MESQDHHKLLGRFALERRLGSGGMSTVYLGRDEVLGRPVAVKLLKGGMTGDKDEDTASRFRREGRTAARLSHANIVPVYDAGEALLIRPETPRAEPSEVSYIVMEYVPGGDLDDLIREHGRLAEDEICRLGGGAADALAHAHGRGVIHRDVKPQNILIDPSGRPKLTDFGIARALGLDAQTHATRTGHYLGTALYSAPEQLRGRKIGGKTDVYALGITLYQAATGDLPFHGTMMEVAQKHLDEIPAMAHHRVPNMNRKLSEAISACLAKNPEERPTAEELSDTLLDLSDADRRENLLPPVEPPRQAASGPEAEPAAAPSAERAEGNPANRTGRRRRGRGAVALVGIAVLCIVVALGATTAFDAINGAGGSGDSEGQSLPAVVDGGQGEANRAEVGASGSESGGSGENAADQASSSGAAVPPESTNPVAEETFAEPSVAEPSVGASTPEESTTPAAEDTGSGTGADEAAVDAIQTMYSSAASGDYATSYGFLTDEMKRTVAPTQAQWSGQFSTLRSLTFEEEPQVEVSGGVATVSGVTRAEHTDRTELNTAVWTLVMEDGGWRLDGQSILDRQLI